MRASVDSPSATLCVHAVIMAAATAQSGRGVKPEPTVKHEHGEAAAAAAGGASDTEDDDPVVHEVQRGQGRTKASPDATAMQRERESEEKIGEKERREEKSRGKRERTDGLRARQDE